MKLFILREKPDRDGIVRLSGKDYHYLVHVRRLKSGAVFRALLPGNAPCEIEVVSTGGGILTGGVKGKASSPGGAGHKQPAPQNTVSAGQNPPAFRGAPSLPPIILFQAMPKGGKTDLIVRQAAEGGVNEVVVFASEHSVIKNPAEAGTARIERWRRVVKEARQQSGSNVDTRLRFLPSLDEALAYWTRLRNAAVGGAAPGKAAALLLHEAAEDTSADGVLEQGSFHGYLGNGPVLVALAAGPEGGFSDSETGCFRQAGFRAVRIGETVLRTETAALYGTAAARIILLERAAWTPKKS